MMLRDAQHELSFPAACPVWCTATCSRAQSLAHPTSPATTWWRTRVGALHRSDAGMCMLPACAEAPVHVQGAAEGWPAAAMALLGWASSGLQGPIAPFTRAHPARPPLPAPSPSTPVPSLPLCTGKMVLLDKLLPKLQSRGSRVLIFSQVRGPVLAAWRVHCCAVGCTGCSCCAVGCSGCMVWAPSVNASGRRTLTSRCTAADDAHD